MHRAVRDSSACALIASTAAVLGGCAGGGASGGDGSGPEAVRGRYILALGDSDLPSDPSSPYLLPRKPGARDSLTIIQLPIREPTTPFAQAEVSSSALGSPGVLALSPDGRFAYVVETRGPAPADAPRELASLPMGDSFATVDLTDPASPVVRGSAYIGPDPRAAAVDPTGSYLAIVTSKPREQLNIAPISTSTGEAGEAFAWALAGLDDDSAAPTSVTWHPSGKALAVSLGERGEVMMYRFRAGADGLAMAAWGPPVKVGAQPIMGAFSKDGRFFVSLDAGASRAARDSQPLGPGRLTVVRVAPDKLDADEAAGRHEVVSTSETGIAPVGMALSPDGALIAVANTMVSVATMDGSSPAQGGSVTLYTLQRDGRLTRHAESVLEAVPAGVSFDAAGRTVCVSQYASLDPQASDGEVSFWEVVRVDGAPGLKQRPFYLGIGGGPHGALIVK
ncbi:MAG: hypothetical protein ACK4WH_01320 [Phycisphaerales bacterium]